MNKNALVAEIRYGCLHSDKDDTYCASSICQHSDLESCCHFEKDYVEIGVIHKHMKIIILAHFKVIHWMIFMLPFLVLPVLDDGGCSGTYDTPIIGCNDDSYLESIVDRFTQVRDGTITNNRTILHNITQFVMSRIYFTTI